MKRWKQTTRLFFRILLKYRLASKVSLKEIRDTRGSQRNCGKQSYDYSRKMKRWKYESRREGFRIDNSDGKD